MLKNLVAVAWIMVAAPFSHGGPNQTASTVVFLRRAPHEMDARGNFSSVEKVTLRIRLDLLPNTSASSKSAIEVEVWDTKGQRIALVPAGRKSPKNGAPQEAIYAMELQAGQDIESVKIRRGQSARTFSYAAGEIDDKIEF